MAHNLLRVVAENPGQENFLLFVGKDHLLSVAKQVADFVGNPASFAAYSRPAQFISDESLADDKSGSIKDELIKTFALAQTIYEQDFAEICLPFTHSQSDLDKLTQAAREINRSLTFVDLFEDFAGLGLTLDKSKDIYPFSDVEKKMKASHQPTTDADLQRFKTYVESEQGGGGVSKCHPVGFIQGNLAYHHLKL
jgi:hypothetical protein